VLLAILLSASNKLGPINLSLGNTTGYIYNLSQVEELNDFEALFILGRQTMNFIDLCGAHTCYADKSAAGKRLLLAIGFKEKDGEYFCDMMGMFDGKCSGHAVDLNKN